MADDPVDVDLDRPMPLDMPGGPPRRKRPPVALFVAAAILVLALAGGYLFLRRGSPSEQPARTATTKPAAVAQRPEPGDTITLPPLDETDPIVRELVGRLSSHPTVAAWLTTDGLIQNFVVVTSRIAGGQTPVAELKALGPIPRLRVKTSEDIAYLDAASYRRYDRYAEAVSALDARGTARLYATVKPRVEDAYKRLGPPAEDFDAVLERAITTLLRVPVVQGDVALEPSGIVYAFADPRLERLSASQKQLLRMGPQNVHAVQSKLREIASYLGIRPVP